MPRQVPAHFDADWYLQTYPDVQQSGMAAHVHYLRHGRAEGRLPCFLVAASRERDLRFGMLSGGLDAFKHLVNVPNRAERAWARLACARHCAGTGDWAAAARWLEPLDPQTDLINGFGLPDDALLAIECAVMMNRIDQAQQLWDLARKRHGRIPDLVLARANIIAVQKGHGASWQRSFRRIFLRLGLGGILLSRQGRTPFDQLAGQKLPFTHHRKGNAPLVSIIMPARNAGGTIDTALRSLINQTWQALEILVVDNGSTDDTVAKVKAWCTQDARVHLLDASHEPGAYPARNIGLAAATGAFVTVLDADDWAHPARIALQAQALIAYPSRMASVSHWVRTTDTLRFTRWWGDRGLIHRNVSSLMIRRSLSDTLGYWDRARAGADTEYYERVLAVYGPRSIHEVRPGVPLSFGRSSTTSLSQSSETHICSHYFGARRTYRFASNRWHRALVRDGVQPLPCHPALRPFAIPKALAMGDPEPSPSPEDTLAESGLFDDHWYMQTYPDLRARNVDGAAHYLSVGADEGRDPGPAFSTTGYRISCNTGPENPVLHYLRTGQDNEGSPLPDLLGHLPPPAKGRHLLFVGHQAQRHLFGAERSLLDMLDRAIATGATPSVLLPHLMNSDYLAALAERSYRIHIRPFGWLYGRATPHPATVDQIAQLICDIGADALHQNTCVLDAPLQAARAAGIPATVHIREVPDQDTRLCLDLGITAAELRHRMLELANRFVANSDDVARWLDAPTSQVTIRPNSIDAELFKLPFTPKNPARVALIGSLTRKKGLFDMISLAQMAHRRGLPAHFVLIGPSSPDMQSINSMPENLHHLGYVDTPLRALDHADIVLSLSKFAESFGRTVLEAMSAGRPVVCYDRGHPPKLLGRDKAAGYVVPADDVTQVLNALSDILSHPGKLNDLSQGARKRANILCKQDLGALDAWIYAT